jgi:hypothetical protein
MSPWEAILSGSVQAGHSLGGLSFQGSLSHAFPFHTLETEASGLWPVPALTSFLLSPFYSFWVLFLQGGATIFRAGLPSSVNSQGEFHSLEMCS